VIVIPEVARPFAEVQIGALDEWRGKPEWADLVDALARHRFETVQPFLPATCRRMMDIGGGVAASDIPILDHYAPAVPELWVLDGDEGLPIVERHDRPFNSMAASAALLEANGHRLSGFVTPDELSSEEIGEVDLFVSFASWGFHFAPYNYLDFVISHSAPGARIILDLRRGKDDWRNALDRRLKFVGLAFDSLKFDRLVYERE
jgi:hypothetical protein